MQQIFNYGTQAEYDAAVAGNIIEPTLLYFIIDTQRIYKGLDLVSMTSVFYLDEVPEVSSARENTMYVVDKLVYIKVGDSLACINHELISESINSLTLFSPSILLKSGQDVSNVDDTTLMTSKKVVEHVSAAISTSFVGAEWSQQAGSISFNLNKENESFDLGLDGLAHDISYDSKKYELTIPVYGKDDIVVSIPTCVKSGRYEQEYLLPDGTYGQAIVLVIDSPSSPSGEAEIVIPAAGLIQQTTYLPYTTDSIDIKISENNELVGNLRINPTENKLVVDKDGLRLDLSEYAMKGNPKDVDKIAVIGKDGQFLGSRKIVDLYTSDESTFVDMIPTFGVVAAAISTACIQLNKHLLPEGDSGMIILSTETGIERSQYTVGQSTLNLSSPSSTTLATESAVVDAMSWVNL